MNRWELFEAIGNLPLETIQIKETGRTRRIFLPYAAALLSLVLVLYSGIFIMRNFKAASAGPDQTTDAPAVSEQMTDTSALSGTTQAAAAFGPVTVFGLAPLESQGAELVSENITFIKDTTRTGKIYGLYSVEMRYTVKLKDSTSFVLPYAYLSSIEEYAQTEIIADGVQIDYKTRRNHAANAARPIIYDGAARQSVSIYPDYTEEERQPADTYPLLIQAWRETSAGTYPEVHYNTSGQVYMYTFTIEDAGTHEIVIKLTALGDDNLCENYMLEWAASPSDMWDDVGDRNLSIEIGEEQYQFSFEDTLFRFEEPKGAEK